MSSLTVSKGLRAMGTEELSAVQKEDVAARVKALENEVACLKAALRRKDTELEEARAEVVRIMKVDPLTGLSNRRAFMETLRKSISFSRRSELPLSIVMGDLDNFKFVIDTYGIDVGEDILIKFAEILSRNSRTEDTAARLGSDEFLLLLPNTGYEEASACAHRLWESVEGLEVEGVSARLSASFGVTVLKEDDTEETFLKRADDALFRAKGTGPVKVATI